MDSILFFGRWLIGGSWVRERPDGSALAWGRLAVSWALTTALVALLFGFLVVGGFLGGVAVALLWPPAQVAILLGLVYAARMPRRTS